MEVVKTPGAHLQQLRLVELFAHEIVYSHAYLEACLVLFRNLTILTNITIINFCLFIYYVMFLYIDKEKCGCIYFFLNRQWMTCIFILNFCHIVVCSQYLTLEFIEIILLNFIVINICANHKYIYVYLCNLLLVTILYESALTSVSISLAVFNEI